MPFGKTTSMVSMPHMTDVHGGRSSSLTLRTAGPISRAVAQDELRGARNVKIAAVGEPLEVIVHWREVNRWAGSSGSSC